MIAVDSVGGETAVVVVALLGFVVALLLGIGVAYKLLTGYRRTRTPEMLQLAVGLLLLTTVPILLRVLLPTFTGISPVSRSLLVSGCELSGLLVVLGVIYDAR
ncbi:hypothetical protein AUR64_16440 [Haloprofundus marisrubri]|uniref:Uncharacterized protein n=1 Tax=Haloprofundus marisrubri TaxID=1514971 RepID=A0A0W1R8F1_9EURY|nr:hypothetical protein [Haloprofundus marisrubri]KTG09367.1 hypothetical protein AUR64_16440 [Haloprofundus marisrubri]